jgi:hypothetical protein
MYLLLADAAVAAHLAFVLFVALGALLAIRWPAVAWVHVPAVAWGVAVEAFGWFCPLTPVENDLRALAGEAAYGGDFIARYLLPVIYPEGLTRDAQFLLAAGAFLLNVGIYANAGARGRGRFAPARYLWAMPNTCLGAVLAVAALAGGGLRFVHGVVEVHGPVVAWLLRWLVPLPCGADAITFGHVVAGRTEVALQLTRAHERVHVRQYERWGPLFIPAYLLAGGWAWVRGRGAYRGNYFERQAPW